MHLPQESMKVQWPVRAAARLDPGLARAPRAAVRLGTFVRAAQLRPPVGRLPTKMG